MLSKHIAMPTGELGSSIACSALFVQADNLAMIDVRSGDTSRTSGSNFYVACLLWTNLIAAVAESAQACQRGSSNDSKMATGISTRTYYADAWPGLCARGRIKPAVRHRQCE